MTIEGYQFGALHESQEANSICNPPFGCPLDEIFEISLVRTAGRLGCLPTHESRVRSGRPATPDMVLMSPILGRIE